MDAVVIGITVCSVGFVALLLLYILLRRDSLAKRVGERVTNLAQRVGEFSERAKLVEIHAADYMNSLSKEATQTLGALRRTIDETESLLAELQGLLELKDFGALQEAELLLNGRHPEQQVERHHFDGTSSKRFSLPNNWEERVEDMLQHLGKEVGRASVLATEAGIPKRPKQQSTIFSLFRAGIRTNRGPYGW
ncbi:MAG: hypothetical protein KDD69_15790 [Bdellovibrionales bacterium]|nr:hypothetical protein [Bdellovibrionales bacterium]